MYFNFHLKFHIYYFLVSNHIDAACLLLDDVLPHDSVAVVLEKYGESQHHTTTRSIIKEHLCIKLYVDSILQYNKWHSYHFSKFPGPPPSPPVYFTRIIIIKI